MNMKKFITVAIIIGGMLSAISVSAFTAYGEEQDLLNGQFTDINGHWAEAVIEKWQDKNIIAGYPDGTFRPDDYVNRAELAKILTLAFNLEKGDPLDYSDIDSSDWYYPYLECSARYIPVYKLPISYVSDDPYAINLEKSLNGFLPQVNAIRMHVAEVLVEIKKEKENLILELPNINDIQSDLLATFKDGDYNNLFIMHSSVPSNVRRMFEYTWLADDLGIMQGNSDGYFLPQGKISRAELVTTIDRILDAESEE